jgi:phage baseplate assembly protein W
MITGVDYTNIFSSESPETKLTQGLDMIKQELTLLLNFRKHSLFFGNNMGLDLEKYLYLTNKTATFNLIRSEIEALFRKYRRVTLKKIEIKFEDYKNAIVINVEVSYDRIGRSNITIPIRIQN